MGNRAELAHKLDELMAIENKRYLDEVPRASHLTDTKPLDESYYLRHRIETIKRIRMTALTDALSLAAMVEEDYEAARIWGRYVCEELDHDRLFYDDLARHGVSRAEVDAVAPFPATVLLGAYLRRRIGEDGSLPAVAYSLFVEWNSERFSRAAVEKAATAFGLSYVEGSRSHLDIDDTEDHYEMMLDIVERLCRRPGAEKALLNDISEISKLFRRYFTELQEYSDAAQMQMA